MLYLASYKNLHWSCFLISSAEKPDKIFLCISPDFLQEPVLLSLVPFSFLWMFLGPLPGICVLFTSKNWKFIFWDPSWDASLHLKDGLAINIQPKVSLLSVPPQSTPQFSLFIWWHFAQIEELWKLLQSWPYVPF